MLESGSGTPWACLWGTGQPLWGVEGIVPVTTTGCGIGLSAPGGRRPSLGGTLGCVAGDSGPCPDWFWGTWLEHAECS